MTKEAVDRYHKEHEMRSAIIDLRFLLATLKVIHLNESMFDSGAFIIKYKV